MELIIVIQLLYLLAMHWLADFVCQTNWQATNKCHDNDALSLHVLTYVSVFIGCGFILHAWYWIVMDYNTLFGYAPWHWIGFCVVNGAIHWVVDYFTSRLNSSLWKQGQIHDFFVSVGFDQFIHATCLFLTYYWFFLKIN